VERLILLNVPALNRTHLFEAARAINGTEEPRGPALVVAQAAVEVGFEAAIDFALQLREVHDPLREWIPTAVSSWSPTNERVQDLWTALTGDKITNAPGWAAYKAGLKWRHAFVHRAAGVPQKEAENFIAAAEEVMTHVVTVMANVFSATAAE
jgi:hypothetical protein